MYTARMTRRNDCERGRKAGVTSNPFYIPMFRKKGIRIIKHHKIIFCAALFALVCAISGRHEEAEAQLIAPDVHKMHAKLFDERTGRGSLLARASREGDLRITILPEVGLLSANANPSPELAFVQSITCGADAVAIGVQEASQSFLTENQEWIFTDDSVSVREVLKDNATHPLAPGSTITVARSGGSIDTPDGHHIVVADPSYPPLHAGGTYVLALRYVPSTGQYWQFDHRGGFHVIGKRALSLVYQSKGAQELHYDFDSDDLSALVRRSAAECLTMEKKQ
jgi:hypothetical protein